jgi:16S rRNA (cytidine1402-2'-O)-methyltransferase
MTDNQKGILYICPTPLGNLKDITLRTLEVFQMVDLIACEDTRRSIKLMNFFDIHKPLISYHEYSKAKQTDNLLMQLKNGKKIALISDAGMPLIADSGLDLVKGCQDMDIQVVVLPGASAVINAAVSSGMDVQNFIYINFLPRKKSKLIKLLEKVRLLQIPIIAFESPFRLLDTLQVLVEFDEKILICVCREMTKIHEEFIRGSVKNVYNDFLNREIQGEITLVFQFEKIEEKKEDENE